ncbi:carboxymuconolactone decarboxylase family protein [Iodidimonas gelatinilytica]|nr:peroxidase-related enzyme [Iodidimonas gelatinilytica]
MSFLPSLPKKTNLSDVIKTFPQAWEPMMDFHDVVLRGDSPLSIAQRELIAAYVSGLNNCHFCLNAHTVYAEDFGIGEDVIGPLLSNPDSAPVDEAMRPILAYVRKLTLEPGNITEADVQAILDAGWSDQAVADANKSAALFNFMNRVILGMGVDDFDDFYGRRLAAVRKKPMEERVAANETALNTQHYRNYGKQLGIIKD